MLENKVLRKIFGIREWRKLHNVKLHVMFSSPNIIINLKSRGLRLAGHVARMEQSRNEYRVVVPKTEGMKPLGRPRRRLEDIIKMDLGKVDCDPVDWRALAEVRRQWRSYVRTLLNLRVP